MLLTPAVGGLCGLQELALELHLPPVWCSLSRLSQPLTPPPLLPQKVLPSGARSVLPRVPLPSPSLPTARPAMFYLEATVPRLR